MARTGTGSTIAGVDSVDVIAAGVAANSIVTAICTSDPGEVAEGAVIEYIAKNAGVGFTLTFDVTPQNITDFDYKIITPRTGTATITEGTNKVTVLNGAVGAGTFVKLSLTSEPGEGSGGSILSYITKSAGVSFTATLANAVQNTTTADYYLIARTDTGTIPAGSPEFYVADPTVGTTSMVEVCLTSDPGDMAGNAALEAIHKIPGYGFIIELLAMPLNEISFDYLIS